MRRLTGLLAIMLAFGLCAVPGRSAAQGATAEVYVVPVHGTIEAGLARFVDRGFTAAEKAGARAVMLEVSTPGGRVDSAIAIKDRVWSSPLPTIAFVKDHAWSAGALVTLAAEKVAMAPGSSIGSAEPRPLDEKTLSAWRAELEAAAQKAGRDPRLAGAMADADVVVPGIKEKGKILNLTWKQAVDLGIADAAAADRNEALAAAGFAGASLIEVHQSPSESVTRFVTNPVVAPVILAAGLLGLLVEALTPGWGAPGIVGLTSLALFFGAQITTGTAGWEITLLFLAGVVLLGIEAFLPGFGVFGMSGIVCLAVSIYLAATRSASGLQPLVIAIIISIVGVFAFVRLGIKRGLWKRLILSATLKGATPRGDAISDEEGGLVGKRGTALTVLRPAGTADVGGRRLDVVTEGEFIERGKTVIVVKQVGTKVVVRPDGGKSGQ